jgi:hypothetical protein
VTENLYLFLQSEPDLDVDALTSSATVLAAAQADEPSSSTSSSLNLGQQISVINFAVHSALPDVREFQVLDVTSKFISFSLSIYFSGSCLE